MKNIILITVLAISGYCQAEVFCESQVAQAASVRFNELATARVHRAQFFLKDAEVTEVSAANGFIAAPNEISKTDNVEMYTVTGSYAIGALRGNNVLVGDMTAEVYTKAGTCEVFSVNAKVTKEESDD